MPGTIGPLANGAGEEAKHLNGNLPSLSVSSKDTNSHSTPGIKDQSRNLSDDDRAVLALRNLIFDLCNHNGGGHGGSAIGMAAIGVALFKHVMRFNPSNPEWFDRDRFVLSNGKSIRHNDALTAINCSIGHCAMFLYALNHLVGIDNWTMDELKGYGSAKTNGYETICHAHPEIEIPGVEVTTGPLGQGIANAVGLAIASKNLAARYNKPDYDVIKSRVYCMTGDGCLMEGVALEAISLAGSLGLDNLTLIYDNNQVTCDGPLDWINTEDVNAKMRASGWYVLEIEDGSYDVSAIVAALRFGNTVKGKPIFINIRTVIGLGTKSAGTAAAHHGTFDKESVVLSKKLAGQDPSATHVVQDTALAYFRERKSHGEHLEESWNELIRAYSSAFGALFQSLESTRKADWGTSWLDTLKSVDIQQFKGKATREINGTLIEKLWKAYPALCGGGADLVNSNKVSYSQDDVFHPSVSYAGRYIRYGIREHAMAAISNGIAAYNPGSFLPITATFFMFYLYVCLILHPLAHDFD
jgi:dihydroxyacetone synthase